MRVLVVEDEERFAAGLRAGLEAEGSAVDVALDGPRCWRGARPSTRRSERPTRPRPPQRSLQHGPLGTPAAPPTPYRRCCEVRWHETWPPGLGHRRTARRRSGSGRTTTDLRLRHEAVATVHRARLGMW